MTNQLVWFRNDLRLDDHRPLRRACAAAQQNGGKVAAVYIADPRWFGKTRFGFDRIGTHRRRFLRQALSDLDQRLQSLGGRLWIVQGSTEEKLPEVAEAFGAEAVYFQQEIAPEEKLVESAACEELRRCGISCNGSAPGTLLAIDDLPFGVDELPETFTAFRKVAESKTEIPEPLDAPASVPGPAEATAPSNSAVSSDHLEMLPESSQAEADSRSALVFRGGESAGLRRMRDYIWEGDHLRRYKETRNGMLGADYSSKLSAWLALGCISARRVYKEVKDYERDRTRNQSTYWLIFELLWRDYFALVTAKHGAKLFQVGGLRQLELPWKQDWDTFDRWRRGTTGFPLIDANMRELVASGYMSNRGRQNVASFLTKNLGIDWRMGAEWFESLLIDHDPCSNYGNWNYNAGVGNDARGFRWFNTTKQAHDYDPDGAYARHWIPEIRSVLKAKVHTPWEMSRSEQEQSGCILGVDYPEPIVDLHASAQANRKRYRDSVAG